MTSGRKEDSFTMKHYRAMIKEIFAKIDRNLVTNKYLHLSLDRIEDFREIFGQGFSRSCGLSKFNQEKFTKFYQKLYEFAPGILKD